MAYDPEGDWIEMHLTPRGWERGDEMDGHGTRIERGSPHDRVKTVRWYRAGNDHATTYLSAGFEVELLERQHGKDPWPR